LLQTPAVHHADPVGHREGLFLIVRDEDRRDPDRALDDADRAPELVADLRVERAERLVEQQHARLMRERPGDGDALLLAARELRRQTLAEPLQRYELEELFPALPPFRGRNASCAERELDVLRDAHVAE